MNSKMRINIEWDKNEVGKNKGKLVKQAVCRREKKILLESCLASLIKQST
jgi:hypothetical protein